MQIGSQTAGKLYGAAIGASKPSPLDQAGASAGDSQGQNFTDTVIDAAQGAVESLVQGEQAAKQMMAGKADAHSVVEALAATEMALEMAVTVRDKVVEAYQEILRMPI